MKTNDKFQKVLMGSQRVRKSESVYTCTYQGVRNLIFAENFADVLYE